MTIGVGFPDILSGARAGADWALEALYRDLAPSVIGLPQGTGRSRAGGPGIGGLRGDRSQHRVLRRRRASVPGVGILDRPQPARRRAPAPLAARRAAHRPRRL